MSNKKIWKANRGQQQQKKVCQSTVESICAASKHKGWQSQKNWKNNQDCYRNDNQNMARTKATVRRLLVKTQRLPGWLVNQEYSIKKTIYPFKIKEILSEQKTVNITKNKKIIKTLNVKWKSKYFNGRKRLIF